MSKKILYVIVASAFAFPVFAMSTQTAATAVTTSSIASYSEEELVALIAKLQKQLEEVRKNKVVCVLADVDLSLGDGEDSATKAYVKSLQNFLKEKGYFTVEPTGYFGKITRAALIAFQKDNGLEQTGELNTSVRTAIKNFTCKKDYSNKKTEVKDTAKNTGSVTSITATGDGATIQWSTAGYSKSGFKIVWSKNTNPTYPTRDGDKYIYLSDPAATSTTLNAWNGAGTYYARVCEYLGGSCGVYSNEITVSL